MARTMYVRGDYGGPAVRAKFGAVLASLALSALAGCSSGLDCIDNVPPELRADTVRYVVDTGMTAENSVPRRDRELGRAQGTLFNEMTAERKKEIARYALGYSHCLSRHQMRR